MVAAAAASHADDAHDTCIQWRRLGAPAEEVQLRFTLPTGQSFRWRPTGPDEFTGVIGQRVFKLRQEADDVAYTVLARGKGADPAGDAAALREYFNLGTRLAPLAEGWAAADKRFRDVQPYIPGARVLRQDPVECAFEFICSSNNHISRIHGMVETLCREFGTRLHATAPALEGEGAEAAVPGLEFYAFPTLEQLSEATEVHLRASGFGYRAKFITGSVAKLLERPEGGAAWLLGLRDVPYPEAVEALCTLPGIGPKVAACVCLFSLDKAGAIPVDTHVWQLACRYYAPHLRNKTLNKQVMAAVETAFVERFGPYAGWAHNTLFIAELASQQEHLPEHLRVGGSRKSPAKRKQPADKAVAAVAAEAAAAETATAATELEAAAVAADRAGASPASMQMEVSELVHAAAVVQYDGSEASDSQVSAQTTTAVKIEVSAAAAAAAAVTDAAPDAAAAAGVATPVAKRQRRRRKAASGSADPDVLAPVTPAQEAAPVKRRRGSGRLAGKAAVPYRTLAEHSGDGG